jgi:surface antigen/DNA-binding CsgD family transcriptional regulator
LNNISYIKIKMDSFSKVLFLLKGGLKKKKEFFKGSLRDPFLCLGITSVALFFLVSFGSNSFSQSLDSSKGFSLSLPSQFYGETVKDDLFLSPEKESWPESPEFLLVGNCALQAAPPPVAITPQVLGMWLGEGDSVTRREITEYIVEEGDNLWSIASRFSISLETIFWANNLKKLTIQPGQKLLILPVSGVMHLVKEGDTVNEIAKIYKTESDKIISFNALSDNSDIFVDELLIIPDGKLPSTLIVETPSSSSVSALSTNHFNGQSHVFPPGQCTWWVAQQRAIPWGGNAIDWMNNAMAYGYEVCWGSDCFPEVGAVISLSGHRTLGHVGYVTEVKKGTVVFSEMNYKAWGVKNLRRLPIGSPSIKGYIY